MTRKHAEFESNGSIIVRDYTPEEESAADIAEQEFENYLLQKEILDAIISIEATITNRRLREALLTSEGAEWLSQKEQEIEVLRAQL